MQLLSPQQKPDISSIEHIEHIKRGTNPWQVKR